MFVLACIFVVMVIMMTARLFSTLTWLKKAWLVQQAFIFLALWNHVKYSASIHTQISFHFAFNEELNGLESIVYPNARVKWRVDNYIKFDASIALMVIGLCFVINVNSFMNTDLINFLGNQVVYHCPIHDKSFLFLGLKGNIQWRFLYNCFFFF